MRWPGCRAKNTRLVVLPVGQVSTIADKIVSLVRSAALDGVARHLARVRPSRVALEQPTAARFPFVRIAPTRSPELGPRTLTDDAGIARLMTEYLLALGHKRIRG